MTRHQHIHIHTPTEPVHWGLVRSLLGDHVGWIAEQAGLDPRSVQPSMHDELADVGSYYLRPGSSILLARCGAIGVGIVGIVPTEDPTCGELVRFYARPSARNVGIGTRLLTGAIATARDLGYRTVVLETCNRFMQDAIRLYERHGFVLTDEPTTIDVAGMVRYRRDLAGEDVAACCTS